MSSPELRLCRYCNRRVTYKNYGIHEVHCAGRNVATTTGAHCGQARLVKKQKERFENFHDSCETELPEVVMNKHEKYYGSKPEVCKKCGSYVMVRDFVQQLEACKKENPSLPCEFCYKLFLGNKLAAHQIKCLNDNRFDKS